MTARTVRILPRSDWPADLQHPEVRGIAVGGCIDNRRRRGLRHLAHAHTHGLQRGWICFRSDTVLADASTRLHELAHVVTREGHTKRWRAFLLQIGGTLDAVPGISRDYHPQNREGRRVVRTDVRADGSVFVTYANGGVTCYAPGSAGAIRRGGRVP